LADDRSTIWKPDIWRSSTECFVDNQDTVLYILYTPSLGLEVRWIENPVEEAPEN